ncbi:beta-1,3-galactosyltransferase 5-like [Asterias amurensis]|uniref:beta-1,3-galactosyltransferase 5-like n=1 Tax=Asterias amurensis TaxID=7602 RepID=UPI003AB7A235
MPCVNAKRMQVIFLKILSSSAAIVATFMTLSTLLMMNLLNSSPHQHNLHNDDGSTSSRRIKTVPNSFEEQTQNAFDAFTVTVWNPKSYGRSSVPSPSCKPGLTLMIMVTSAPNHYERRKAIRETWGKDWVDPNNTEWRTVFMVGRTTNPTQQLSLEKESQEHGDLLMGNYIDSYKNLTIKVQHGMSWSLETCQPQYLLKTDDDCFVNSKLFTKFLNAQNKKRTKLYAGYAVKNLNVIRDKRSKWYVSRETYQPSEFPVYASGAGYVISHDVLQSMVTAAKFLPAFAAEDAFTGLLAESTNIPLLDSARFALNNMNWRLCNYLYLLVVHGVTPEQQVLGFRYSVECHKKCNSQAEATDWN